jgi:hypothetical protein
VDDLGALRRRDERLRRLEAERDELRAILAPLLDHPYLHIARLGWCCTFCAAREGTPHEGHCPVLRRDALLGRA